MRAAHGYFDRLGGSMIRTTDRRVWARRLLALAVFSTPLIFSRATTGVFDIVKLSVLWALGSAAFGLWLSRALETGIWLPKSRLIVAAGAFIAVCVLATIFSRAPIVSFLGVYLRYGGLVSLVLYAAVMLAVVGVYWERPEDLDDLATAAAAAAVLMSLYVLVQAAGLDWIVWRNPDGGFPYSPVGTMGNSNFAGGYLGIASPYLVYMTAKADSRRHRSLWAAGLGLVLLAIWYTNARGGLLACVAGLSILAWFYRDRLSPAARMTAAATATLVALGAVVAIGFHGGVPAASRSVFRSETLSDRVNYWKSAVKIAADHPVLGTGPDTFYASYPPYRLRADGVKNSRTSTDKPHNIFLEYAANAGLLGIGAYLALVGLALRRSARAAKKMQGAARMRLVVFLASLAAYLSQGAFSIDVVPLALTGWLAIGAIVAITAPPRPAQAPAKSRAPVFQTILLGSVAVLILVGMFPLAADISSKRGDKAASPEKAEHYYRRAAMLNPLEATYRSALMRNLEAQAGKINGTAGKERLLAKSAAEGARAIRIRPGFVGYLAKLADVDTTWAQTVNKHRFPYANRAWKDAVQPDPFNWILHQHYASMLDSWAASSGNEANSLKRGVAQWEQALALNKDLTEGWLALAWDYAALNDAPGARRALSGFFNIGLSNDEFDRIYARLVPGDAVGGTPSVARSTFRRPSGLTPEPKRDPVAFVGTFQSTNSASWAAALNGGRTKGALVLDTVPGSPAAAAKLKRGDVMVAIDGQAVADEEQATVLLNSPYMRRHRVTIVSRTGERRIAGLTVKEAPADTFGRYASEILRTNTDPVSQFIAARALVDPVASLIVVERVIARLPEFSQAYALRAKRLSEMLPVPAQSGAPEPNSASQLAVKQDLAKAIQLDPESLTVRESAAAAALARGDFAEAEIQATAALQLDPLSARSHDLLGRSKLGMDRTDKALPSLQRAVALNPYAPSYSRSLSQAYLSLGRSAEATKRRPLSTVLASASDRGLRPKTKSPPEVALTAGIMVLGVGWGAKMIDSLRQKRTLERGSG